MVEYVLMPGVNDAKEHALEISAYLKPIGCTLNIIPYNPVDDSPWPKPTEESVASFIKTVQSTGQFARRRITLGQKVMAACGQLGNQGMQRSECDNQ